MGYFFGDTTPSVRSRINDGCYNTTLKYPESVRAPANLSRMAKDLTLEELKALPGEIETYEAAKRDCAEKVKAYNAQIAEAEARFKADLEAEHGVEGNPKANLLWSKAWELGHASGYSDVVSHYEDLVELIK